MARMDIGDKATRVLKLLMGLRNPRVATAMAAHGFGEADLKEGWSLLQGVSKTKLDAAAKTPADPTIIDKLDAWENRWFPIAAATVERRFPAVHAQLFKNLSQTSGPAVAVSVRTFVQRFDEMAAGAGAYGAEGTAAKEVLAARGLTTAVLDEARALLETVGRLQTLDAKSIEEEKGEIAKAEEALWAWYLEWSQIARVAVTQRALLREMGFVANRAKAKDDEHDDGDVDPTTGVVHPTQPVQPIN